MLLDGYLSNSIALLYLLILRLLRICVMRIISKIVFSWLLVAVVSACGFHLRGQVQLSNAFTQLTLVNSASQSFGIILREQLQNNGVQLVENADIHLEIVSLEFHDKLPISAANATVSTVHQTAKLIWTLKKQGNETLIEPSTIVQTNSFTKTFNDIANTQSQSQNSKKYLEKALSLLLVKQLEQISENDLNQVETLP